MPAHDLSSVQLHRAVGRHDSTGNLEVLAHERQLRCLHCRITSGEHWTIESVISAGGELIEHVNGHSGKVEALFSFPNFILEIATNFGDGHTHVEASAATPNEAEEACKFGMSVVSEAATPEDAEHPTVPIIVWSSGEYGANHSRVTIDAPFWTDIQPNYTSATQGALAAIMEGATPETISGGVGVWYGNPGTGKTTALRALCREWSGRASIEIVMDPGEFFTGESDTLRELLLHRDEQSGQSRGQGQKDDKLRLLVFEDAGEFVAADARAEVGRGLSRLLNVTDGLIGDGLHLAVLITTNEPIKKLHPAIRRPGRCWSKVEFKPLSAEEANAWYRHKDSELTVNSATTIAEAYSGLRGFEKSQENVFGFHSTNSA